MKVAGFEFESVEQGQLAAKELQAIQYVKTQTKMDDPDVVLRVYTALIKQNAFETPVGFAFLDELQEYLRTIPYIKQEDIVSIPVKAPVAAKSGKKDKRDKKEAEEKKRTKVQKAPKEKSKEPPEPKRYKALFRVTLFFAIVFLLAIGGMFAITYLSGDNTNILNYEDKLIDKYEQWELNLKEREQMLKDKELDIRDREERLEEKEQKEQNNE